MTDKPVQIIFRTDFGERLRDLDLSAPIWVIQSSDNDPVVYELWRAKAGNITKFKSQDFDNLLPTIDEHHPGWRELQVYGVVQEVAQRALTTQRGEFSSKAADVFLFRKVK